MEREDMSEDITPGAIAEDMTPEEYIEALGECIEDLKGQIRLFEWHVEVLEEETRTTRRLARHVPPHDGPYWRIRALERQIEWADEGIARFAREQGQLAEIRADLEASLAELRKEAERDVD